MIVMFASRFQWTFAALNAFLILFLLKKLFPPSSNTYDPIDVKNIEKFHLHMNALWVQFVWHLLAFFVYAYL